MSLPTLYDYYTGGGINAGLSADQSYFTLNNRNITLFSGAMHYFRVPQEYWRDRLRKMRSAGLNAVETYVPWNLHEPEPGVFDFGRGGTDFQEFLDVEKFLKIAQEEDLLAIVRPGPYICAEWDFGGLPSWLLREKGIRVRTSDEVFMDHVKRYFGALLAILTALQFTKGGPVVAVQIENEYGSTDTADTPVDMDYLEGLRDMLISNGIVELLFTSDGPSLGNSSQIPGVLFTGNFQDKPEQELSLIEKFQPGKPLMAMEYWTGWFDHWIEEHNTRSDEEFKDVLERIIKYPASVNMYMFHGGTNWGFLNGANIADGGTDNAGIQHDTTSYDYDAPISENGDYTDKFYSVVELVNKYNEVKTQLPEPPQLIERIAYDPVEITEQLTISEIISRETPIASEQVVSMEMLPINNGAGQQYGYLVYQKVNLSIPANSVLKIEGHVSDTVMVLIDGALKSNVLRQQSDFEEFGYWRLKDSTLDLGDQDYNDATLELVVENWGRNNFGRLNQFNQFKGLWQGNVSINGQNLFDWNIFPLEFRKSWTNGLSGWRSATFGVGPALYKGVLKIKEARDTYIDMRGWNKGIIIVNGFVLSRHLRIGPQQAAYLPAPLLKLGANEIIIFEHFIPDRQIKFITDIVYELLP